MKIKNINTSLYKGIVHDIEVETFHNYYVESCLVHNCHESSTTKGQHGDLSKLAAILSALPQGVELAIGGGNPLSHPYLKTFLSHAKEEGFICNLTVNQGHLGKHFALIEELISEGLIKGIGVSITSNNFVYIKKLSALTKHMVIHVIAGVADVKIMDRLIELDNPKVLVLGYKQFGFGIDYYSDAVQQSINKWYSHIRQYFGKCVLSFDNLALEQLKIKRFFTDEGWDCFYMGDDGHYSMYIDAVKQEYARTSRSSDRTSFQMPLLDYFKHVL